jgi:hypothetical protein
MKKGKKNEINKLVIFSIATMFIITFVQTSGISTSITDEKYTNNIGLKFKKIENINPIQLYEKPFIIEAKNSMILDTDTLIYGGTSGEIIQNPTITDNNGQNILIGFEVWPDWLSPADPFFRYSNDGGITWQPENNANGWSLSEVGYYSILPVIDFAGDIGAFGCILPIDQNNWVTFNFPSIIDPEYENGWTANSWTADVMMSEWHSVDVCGVNIEYAPSEEAFGLAIWTGDTVDGLENGLWYGWEINDGSEFTVYPEFDYEFEADQAVNDIDLSTGKYYQSFYRFNDLSSNPYGDGVFLRSVQLDGTDEWVNSSWDDILNVDGATNPDIKACDGNCYLVYEFNGGIGCHYSNDDGVNFNSVTISDNGYLPSISAIGDTIVVGYIKNGNIYNSVSDDGGVTWVES